MKTPRHQGFTLVEILITLMLLSVFAFVASQVCTGVFTVFRENEAAQTRISRYESALSRMRKDVWGASSIEVSNPARAILHYTDGPDVTWQITAGGDLLRAAGTGVPTQWDQAAPKLIFQQAPAALLLTEKDEEPALATRLVSQVILGGGGK